MTSGGALRRGLHIDDDDDGPRKPDEYGGFDASRKKGNTQRGLDDMLFGGPVRKRVPPVVKPQQVKNNDSSKPKDPPKPNTAQIKTPPVVVNPVKPAEPAKTNTSTEKPVIKKQPSILAPAAEDKHKQPIGTIPIISKPKIDNYVQPAPPKPENPQPAQQIEEISLEVLHPFGNKNKFQKPGYLRKSKKIAEDFKFSEENVTLHSAVDVVRPVQTDRTKQRKLNDFDFHDFQFPAVSASLGIAQKETASIWKRPNELAKTVNFGKYIDPNDFQPGTLSSPHFLSALSGIAELQANTKRLIQDQKVNSNGFYLVRLFINSVWRYVPVDNLLPFVAGENAGVLSNTEGGEFDLQGALIEKAYAKSLGGYDAFARVQPREYYLRDLTGAPVRKYPIDHPDLQNIVKKALASGQVVQAVPTDKIAALGANPNFSYTVINYSSKGSLQLRNSWGTLEQRSKTVFKSEGNFELNSSVLRDNISHVIVTNVNPAYNTTTVQARHRLGFYSTYTFRVRNNTHGFLTVSQWDERLFPATSGYQYSPATIILQKDDDHTEFVSANHTAGSRNLDLEVNLAPGNYTAFVAVNWRHEEHSFNLSFYGSERVDFTRIYNEKDPNHIARSLQAVNVAQGKRTEPSKTSAQYTTYHLESNLLLLTVENTTTREGRVTLDLTRAKLDNLTLVSGHNNEENYSEKAVHEIDEYKNGPLSDKRWAVSLEGGSRFTWVLASRVAYSESNPKSWGFN